jgi:dGTPase
MTRWPRLLCDKRFSDILGREKPNGQPPPPDIAKDQFRTAGERDHDRILFSTPFRRMGDKTQVFPLESIESIRTRLTHSYEVANLARSLGTQIAETHRELLPANAIRTIPAILAAVGLAHDIGNPPFGHQGEKAIRAWFKRNSTALFEAPTSSASVGQLAIIADDLKNLTDQHKNDFLIFEGNAQTLRVVTKLQVIGDDLGLNLTLGTLASLMKYVAPSHQLDDKTHAREKVGFFTSEQALVQRIRAEVGLEGDARHPLALVMEACDDIAYSVLDSEDSVKKGLVSFNDLTAWLRRQSDGDPVITYVCEISEWEHKNLAKQKLLTGELKDVATQKFRVHAIHVMVSAVAAAFQNNYDAILSGAFDGELIKKSSASGLCKALKTFDRENAFSHRSVLEIELNGYNTINSLMDFLWMGISERIQYSELESDRTNPFSAYVYSRISRNYRRVFEGAVKCYHANQNLPIRYKELQLLSDMISGMTDRFCMDLFDDLDKHYKKMRSIDGKFA